MWRLHHIGHLIEAKWRMHASVYSPIIGPDTGHCGGDRPLFEPTPVYYKMSPSNHNTIAFREWKRITWQLIGICPLRNDGLFISASHVFFTLWNVNQPINQCLVFKQTCKCSHFHLLQCWDKCRNWRQPRATNNWFPNQHSFHFTAVSLLFSRQ